MNSKQRRILKRKFPYTTVYKTTSQHPIPAEIYKWCDNTFGEDNFIKQYDWWQNELTIRFAKSEHLNWFLIRWGSEF